MVPAKDTLIGDRSNISELMNMAWCVHEITDEYLKEVYSCIQCDSSNLIYCFRHLIGMICMARLRNNPLWNPFGAHSDLRTV